MTRSSGEWIPKVGKRTLLINKIDVDTKITVLDPYLGIALDIITEDKSQETDIGAMESPDIVALKPKTLCKYIGMYTSIPIKSPAAKKLIILIIMLVLVKISKGIIGSSALFSI